MSRVSITCSGGGERERCLRRRKKRAPSRRAASSTKAPRAIPTLAAVERPLLELVGVELDVGIEDAIAVIVPVGPPEVVVMTERVVAAGRVAVIDAPGTLIVPE